VRDVTPWAGRTPRAWQVAALDAVLGALRSGVRHPLIRACTGSGKSSVIAELCARSTGRVLVTTPTQALVDQLAATLSDRCGTVGRAYQHAWDLRRITVTCNASLSALLDEQPAWDCWIADEAHRLEGDTLRTARNRIQRKCGIGFTATPFRADERGLVVWDREVFAYSSADAVRDSVLVPWRVVRWDGEGDANDIDGQCERWIRGADGPGIVSATCIDDAEAFAARVGVLAIHGQQTKRERARRIAALLAGDTRALVHCNLLAEGVDIPDLCWICLRRPVASPVRVVQEVGRVLRAAPGKTHATIYDPYNTLEEVGLDHPSRLDDALASGQRRGATDDWTIPELEGLPVASLPPMVAVDRISGWTTDLIGALRAAGLAAPPDRKYGDEDAGWRSRRATPAQRAALQRMEWACRYLSDEGHRRAARWVMTQESLRAGTASNLLDALKALADASAEARAARRHWHLLVDVPEVAA
jgi:superfamily II DNA or RNA helicase